MRSEHQKTEVESWISLEAGERHLNTPSHALRGSLQLRERALTGKILAGLILLPRLEVITAAQRAANKST